MLPFWLHALDGPYRDYLAHGAAAWIHWQHDFSVRSWADGNPRALTSDVRFPMPLKDAQQQALMDACFVHFVVGNLLLGDVAAAMKGVPAQQRYGFVSDQLQRAMRWGLTNTADLHAYCTTALLQGARFDELPIVADALRTAASEGWPTVAENLAAGGWPEKGQG